ncbi:Protein kinase domain [Macleaya cordata]|uniref:non-specific serine/threonine protein kinase n=1 Tax=Macleaya cordata TaxID=56857 RepID=A0A200R6W3_MACCD|nr:Protein kinase domain [Macleaya cordata]
MGFPQVISNTLCFAISVLLLLSSQNSIFQFANSASLITVDQEALLSFKSLITDPSNTLSSWNQNNLSSACNWTGVNCGMINNNQQQRVLRVVGLDLEGLGLSGTLSPYLGNLSFLQSLHLPNNKFSGTLPNQIGKLSGLRRLNMSNNNIQGQIPPDISKCLDLVVLDLMGNQVSGFIPPELGQSLSKLQVLKLNQNRISGTIPPSIGNISSLTTLDLGTNSIGGPIPDDLGRLQNLKELRLSINNLTGTIPPSLYNLSSLVYFALPSNRLWGEIPSDIGEKLPKLIEFNFCINKFTGGIPGSLHNLTNIQIIRMADNLLEGSVPPGLENLRSLRMYNIGYNRIEGSLNFVASFSNSPHLEFLALDGNLFEGVIPESIGFNLSAKSLTKLYLGGNRLNGKIPTSIGRLTNLALLNLSHNSISGEIPPEISQLENLQMLGLAGNKISGEIPSSLGSLRKLNKLELFGNELVGSIPNSLGNFQGLLSMDLSRNRLSGSIPRQVLSGLSTLTLLNLSRNSLNGPLPPEISNMENLVTIDISHNSLSGSIPDSIDECESLEELFMAGNSFSGRIPSTLGSVKGLETLDLSSNQLSGPIPNELQNLQALQFLNLSFNNLEGKLPTNGVFRNLSRVHVQGNSKLCVSSSSWVCRRKKSFATRVIVPIVIASITFCILVGLFVCIFLMYRRKVAPGGMVRNKKGKDDEELFKGKHQMVSYEELRAGTENFEEKNLIGSGSFGSVYKGTIWGGIGVAVKVLNLGQVGASKSFFAECEALRNVRHRNLVKLITSCSSVDSRTNSEFRALVYELLSNGSLEDWIRGRRRTRSSDDDEEDAVVLIMNGMERLNVAIDVASALDYLHHDCEAPVVHCDIKPSNVILDEDMTAKVGDFGLARTLMLNQLSTTTSTYGLKGSIGYIPPEYGLGGKVSTRGDVYSYGVMLLEMFTGRSPTHQDFNGGLSLVKWVESAYPTNIMQVLDPQMLHYHDHHDHLDQHVNKEKEEEECWVSIMGIGLSCTVDSAEARITIREALHKLKTLRDSNNLGGLTS